MTLNRRSQLQTRSRLQSRTGLRRGGQLERRTSLAREGRRGKRLRGADQRARREAKRHTCPCGCGTADRRLLDWVHLDGRSEHVRHSTVLTLAMCRDAHEFIDHQRPACREDLRLLAVKVDRRLTEADVRPVMERYGYTIRPDDG